MTLVIKTPASPDGYAVTVDAKHIIVTDLTGAYSGTNLGGWGAPNVELNQSCIFALVIRKASTGDEVFEGWTSLFVYDSGAANDKETGFDIKFALDGVLDIVIGRLPVSANGSTTVDTIPVALTEGMFFYYLGKVYKKVSGVNVEVTDYTDLVGEVGVLQSTCDDVLYPMLCLEQQSIYKEFVLEELEKCPDADDLFNKSLRLYMEMVAVSRAFWSNLKIQAQDKLETLLTKYEITENEI